MDKNQDTIDLKIVSAIQSGNLFRLSRLIGQNIRKSKGSKEARIDSAIYYRRLGADKKALKVLDIDLKPLQWERCPDLELKIQFQAVQIVAFLGATRIALSLASQVPETRRHLVLPQLSSLYFFCGDYESSYRCSLEMLKTEGDKSSVIHSTTLMAVGFSQGLLVDCPSAEATLVPMLTQRREDRLFQLNVRLCLLISLVYGGKAQEAEKLGRDVLENDGPQGLTLASFQEYYGASLVMLGRNEEARKYLDLAFEKLNRPGSSPLAWVGVIYWKGLIEFNKCNNQQQIPAEWARILVYPQPVVNERQKMIRERIKLPLSIMVNCEGQARKISKVLHYEIASKTKIFGYGTSAERHEIGLDLLDRALLTLVTAGKFGISEYGLFDELWRGDVSLDQCQRRISQVVQRLRQRGYSVQWTDAHIWLKEATEVTCLWSSQPHPKGWMFLSKHPKFSRKDVQNFFSLSRTKAFNVCADWVKEGLISRDPGNAFSYSVVTKDRF